MACWYRSTRSWSPQAQDLSRMPRLRRWCLLWKANLDWFDQVRFLSLPLSCLDSGLLLFVGAALGLPGSGLPRMAYQKTPEAWLLPLLLFFLKGPALHFQGTHGVRQDSVFRMLHVSQVHKRW